MTMKSLRYKFRRSMSKLPGRAAALLCVLLIGAAIAVWVNDFSLVLSPAGESPLILEQGKPYTDPGVEAMLRGRYFFREGLPVQAEISGFGQVDTTVPGTYNIRYSGKFLFWEGEGSRDVAVADRIPPTITLNSIPGHVTVYGEPYGEEGYSAWDSFDGDLTDRVVRYKENGFVYYSVEDSFGNRTCVARKIHYIDPIPPEIILTGGENVTVEAGKPFEEPGFTACDNLDGDLSYRVTVEGEVAWYRSGTYELTYTVRDHAGNETAVTRTVTVLPRPYSETVTPEGKVIYLTFDDGPCYYTEELLDILARYDVKVTFFVVDGENREVLRRIVEEGHSIGVHSETHDYGQIYASADAFFEDLYTMQHIICEETGVTTYLMRFPGGSSNTVSRFNPGIMTYLVQAVEDCGFRYFDWNVDSNDAGGAKSASEVFENVTDAVQYRRISIVLQHDSKPFSVDAVERIILWGLENGYTFLPLDMSSPTAHHGTNN